MIYLDTSFLAPFYIQEATSTSVEEILLNIPTGKLAIMLGKCDLIVISKVTDINPAEIAVTVITIVEQMYGRLDVVKKAKSKQELVTAYALLKQTFNRLCQENILDFNETAFDIYS